MNSCSVSIPRSCKMVFRTAASSSTAIFRPAATGMTTLRIGSPSTSSVGNRNGKRSTSSSSAPPQTASDYAALAIKAGDQAETVVLPNASHYDEIAASSPSWQLILPYILKALGMTATVAK